jgi:hypothetical protein
MGATNFGEAKNVGTSSFMDQDGHTDSSNQYAGASS